MSEPEVTENAMDLMIVTAQATAVRDIVSRPDGLFSEVRLEEPERQAIAKWLESYATRIEASLAPPEPVEEEVVKHGITSVDEQVRGYPGTMVTCLCGWTDRWGVRDGSAEAEGHQHMMNHDPEYVTWYREHVAKQKAEHAEWLKTHPLVARVAPAKPKPIHQHDCSCHIDPPCERCVNCRHVDHPECPNDCQTCDEHAWEVAE